MKATWARGLVSIVGVVLLGAAFVQPLSVPVVASATTSPLARWTPAPPEPGRHAPVAAQAQPAQAQAQAQPQTDPGEQAFYNGMRALCEFENRGAECEDKVQVAMAANWYRTWQNVPQGEQ